MQKSVLITGVTGYVGIHLLSRLVRQNNIDRIFCVTRHKDHDSFWSAIKLQANQFNITMDVSDIQPKLDIVNIDLAQNHNSILPALQKFKQSVKEVHHLACDGNYGHPLEYFQPWINTTKELIQFCMDSTHPKSLYAVGSYGQHIIDTINNDKDYYWINGYFKYKRWLYNYMLEKMDEGLQGTLIEPGVVVGTIDPGQKYSFWRITRIFAATGYAFNYPMVFTPIDMLIDNYILAQNYPHESPKVISPLIPKYLYVNKAVQKLLPDLKVIDYEKFRTLMEHVMPEKAKYFGPNFLRSIYGPKLIATFHPFYDTTKYVSKDVIDYLSDCKSLTDAVEQGLKSRTKYMTALEETII
ncbi:hypothetical protein I4U23_022124 [Adineta vaga]|nr:hypothetical protein I4U23_022124 [Adineta vaga]